MHLVVIADDITGAFDTGVQFAKRGARVNVSCIGRPLPGAGAPYQIDVTAADVTVIDAETRHLPAAQAARVTGEIVNMALAEGATNLYIKTDSGLRGHVGETIAAALIAGDAPFLAFVPAYPTMDRITVGGVQYIHGVPLRDSEFGRDPFEPVTADSVAGLFEHCGVRVELLAADSAIYPSMGEQTVGIFDAAKDEDLHSIAQSLKEKQLLGITAGCAAFAAALADVLGFDGRQKDETEADGPLLVICGSLNDITTRQIAWAVDRGAQRISLDDRQLLDSGWIDSAEGQAWMAGVCAGLDRERTVIIDTGNVARPEDAGRIFGVAAPAEIGRRIADSLGYLTGKLLDEPSMSPYTLMIIGGDTLMGFLRNSEQDDVILLGEPVPGVVRFSIGGRNGRRVMLSKSGGFGGEKLLTELAAPVKMMR